MPSKSNETKRDKRKFSEIDISEELSRMSECSSEDNFEVISNSSSDNEIEINESSDCDDEINPINVQFVWQNCDDVFQCQVRQFENQNDGITDAFTVTLDSLEREYFEAYFDDELMNILVLETNRYHQFCVNEGRAATGSKQKPYTHVTVSELYSFFALTLLMPHVKKPVLHDYWSVDYAYETPIFRDYISRHRYGQILRFLHFADNNNPNEQDRLWKIRNVFQDFVHKFTKFYNPLQKLVIDESLVLFKGKVKFTQYIPSKRHRFGIKLFVLCDCETGIVLDIIVYTASDVVIPKDPVHGVSGAVVKKLLDKHLDKGHILYTDNWYTSPNLSAYLYHRKTGTCGTVKKNRKNFPVFENIAKGTCSLKKSNNLLAVKWNDKRDVHMITTEHAGAMINSGKNDYRTNEPLKKPDCVIDYNVNMRLVDKSDMQISAVECVRKSIK